MKKIYFLFVIVLIGLVSCTTTNSIVSKTADLSKYKYVTIVDLLEYGGSPSLMGLEIKIHDILSDTRLKVLGERQIESLSDEQIEQLLLVRFEAIQEEAESIVSINFVDYANGRPIASCRGVYGMSFTCAGDMKVALKKVAKEVKKIFGD